MSNFDNAFLLILGAEGGYVNDPVDPGGETNFGISKRAYPNVDIKALTAETAKAIYKADYWDRVKGDDLPWPLSLYVFDCAVNQGVDVAKTLLQKAIGTVQDGVIGPNTLRAIQKANQQELGALYMADRALRYTGTRNFDKYGRGWLKRLFVITGESHEPD